MRRSIKKILREQLEEAGMEDSWERDDVKVTLKQLLDAAKDVPVKDIRTEKLKDIVLDWGGDPHEFEKAEKTDLQYPVLIFVDDDNEVEKIIDGNHRVQKAIKNDVPYVKAKLIKVNELPEDFQYVFK